MALDDKLSLAAIGAIYLLMVFFGASFIKAGVACGMVAFIYIIGNNVLGGAKKKQSRKKYDFISDESIFNNSIFVLIAAVIKADGKPSDVELSYTERALKIHFKESRVQQQIRMIKNLCADVDFDYRPICHVINMNYRFAEKIQLMHFLVGIVTADGLLTKIEYNIIKDIASRIKLPLSSVKAILRMFNFISEEEVEERQRRKEQKKSYTSSYTLAKSYDILGITQNATIKQIKKAYRKLALKHHPDRLIHLGEEHQLSAKEKFQLISDAYEYIKEVKGFS